MAPKKKAETEVITTAKLTSAMKTAPREQRLTVIDHDDVTIVRMPSYAEILLQGKAQESSRKGIRTVLEVKSSKVNQEPENEYEVVDLGMLQEGSVEVEEEPEVIKATKPKKKKKKPSKAAIIKPPVEDETLEESAETVKVELEQAAPSVHISTVEVAVSEPEPVEEVAEVVSEEIAEKEVEVEVVEPEEVVESSIADATVEANVEDVEIQEPTEVATVATEEVEVPVAEEVPAQNEIEIEEPQAEEVVQPTPAVEIEEVAKEEPEPVEPTEDVAVEESAPVETDQELTVEETTVVESFPEVTEEPVAVEQVEETAEAAEEEIDEPVVVVPSIVVQEILQSSHTSKEDAPSEVTLNNDDAMSDMISEAGSNATPRRRVVRKISTVELGGRAVAASQVTGSVFRTNPILLEVTKGIDEITSNDPTLTQFDVKDFKLSATQCSTLAQGLANNTVLKNLNLSNAGISNASAIELAKSLAVNQSVNYLNLEGNHIGPTGMAAIANALGSNRSILEIRLANQKSTTSTGFEAENLFVKALSTNTTLVKLGLQFRDVACRNSADRSITRNKEIARKSQLEYIDEE